MANLYDVKQAGAIAAALKAVIELAAGAPAALESFQSYKITVDALRRKLGLASKETAAGRIEKLIDLGALEEDEEKRGRGRGSPRFHRIKKTSLEGDVADNVFPPVKDVREIFEGGGPTVRDVREKKKQPDQQDSRTSGSCPETTRNPDGDFLVFSENHPDSKDSPNNSTAYPSVRLVHPTPSASSLRDDAKKRGNARKSSGLTATECIAAVRGAGGTLTLWPDGAGFDIDLRSVADATLARMLLDAVSASYDAILAALRREAGLDRSSKRSAGHEPYRRQASRHRQFTVRFRYRRTPRRTCSPRRRSGGECWSPTWSRKPRADPASAPPPPKFCRRRRRPLSTSPSANGSISTPTACAPKSWARPRRPGGRGRQRAESPGFRDRKSSTMARMRSGEPFLFCLPG